MIISKKNNLKKIFFLFKFILFKYFKVSNNKQSKKLVVQFFKSHFLVIAFIRISFFILNCLSYFLYKKKFVYLKFDQFWKLLVNINKVNFLQSNKIIELFHAITTIHLDGKEKSQKIIIENKTKIKNFYENLIIGSGPGGSITANKLIQSNKKVLLMEKGNWFKHFNLKHPGEELFSKWKYGGLAAALGNVKIQYASAECFGGGSEINSGLYHEPDEEFLNEWSSKFKTKDLTYSSLKNL